MRARRAVVAVLALLGASALARAADAEPPQAPPPEAPAEATPQGGPGGILYEGEGDAGDEPAPASPFGDQAAERTDAVPGAMELSDGRVLAGRIYTTRDRRLKVFDLEDRAYKFVPTAALKRIEAVVEWERMDRDWRFKEAGSPEKVYSDREHPVRLLAWRLTLRNDQVLTGHILGQPLYVTEGERTERWILHKRHKGEDGQALADLVYIRRVDFGPEAYAAGLARMKAAEEAKAKAAAASEGKEPAPAGGKEPAAAPAAPAPEPPDRPDAPAPAPEAG